MNLVGKIFTALIAVMSIIFMAFALMVQATHKNWKETVDKPIDGFAAKLTDAVKEKRQLEEKKKSLEDAKALEKARAERVRVALETENQQLLKERHDNETRIASLEAQTKDAVHAMDAVHTTLAALRKEADSLRESIKIAEGKRDESFKQVVDLTDKLNNAVQDFKRLEKQNQDLVAELSKAQQALAYFKITGDYKAKQPPAGLEGEVTAVRSDMIEISVGGDDGLRKGHKMEVVRVGSVNSYVGRIEVLETSGNRAVCRADNKMLRSPIQRGDRVFADLSQVH